MTEIPRWEQKLQSFTMALNRLAQVVNESKKRELNEFEMDSVVQRFEFTHEIAWKVIQSYAKYQGNDTIAGSRDAARWAFENHLITNGQAWMDMIRSRNDTSHNYDSASAQTSIDSIINVYYDELLAFNIKMRDIASSFESDLFGQE